MNGFKSIMGKELTRVFKDKKLIFSMFILPLVVMLGIFFLIFTLISNMADDIEKHISIVYVQNVPEDFRKALTDIEDMTVNYVENGEDLTGIKLKIKNGEADLLVEFPEGFADDIADYINAQVPQVKTYYNPSEDYSTEARNKFVGTYLEGYRQTLVSERFGSIDAVVVFTVDSNNEETEIVDEDKAAGKMLGMFVPYFITMMIFAGAMGIGGDSIAGEKERGTLASLLLTPVRRVEIVMGKIVALGILSIMSALVYVVGMLVGLSFGMKQVGENLMEGMSISLTGTQIIELIVLIIGIVLMYVAIICIVSVAAKTVKEAQTYMVPVYMIVIVAGIITMYASDTSSMGSYFIPLFNSSVAFKGIFTREITLTQFAAAAIVTYGFAAVLIGLTAKAFKSEKIMFNA